MLAEYFIVSVLSILAAVALLSYWFTSRPKIKPDETKIEQAIEKEVKKLQQTTNTTYLRRRQRNRKKKHERQSRQEAS